MERKAMCDEDNLLNGNEENLTYEDAQNYGIDMSMIKTCKKIRNLAKLDRIRLDETEHRSGLNKHLFDYIEYCGYDVLDFIRRYLSNIQPYMIVRRKDQEPNKVFLCVMDDLYRISVYIKMNTEQFEEVIVSFHENNIRGVAKSNHLQTIENRYQIVPVIADEVTSRIIGQNRYSVKVFVQRGMMILPIEIVARKCQDVFLVDAGDINRQFVSYCNDYIKELYTSDLNLDYERITVFSMLQQISFTSYGQDTFSGISLLIDSLNIQKDFVSRSAADFALITFVSNLKLTQDQRQELMELLNTKYKVSDMKQIDIVLERIDDNLAPAIDCNTQEVIIDRIRPSKR